MSELYSWLIRAYYLVSVLPFAVFIAVWFGTYLFMKDKKRSTHISMDVTALFLVGSVSLLVEEVFDSNFGFWFILLFILITAGLLGGYQNRIRGKVQIGKIVRAELRLGFMLLSTAYVFLAAIGIVKQFFLS